MWKQSHCGGKIVLPKLGTISYVVFRFHSFYLQRAYQVRTSAVLVFFIFRQPDVVCGCFALFLSWANSLVVRGR